MSGVATILALWVAFAASHMFLSSVKFRPRLVGALGQGGFLGLYSVIALAIFVPLVSVYMGNKHAGPFLWYWGGIGGAIPVVRWVVYVGMGLAFALAVAGNVNPSPASIAGNPDRSEVRGMLRVTRHPLLMGIGLFGLLHLCVARVNVSELVFFGGLPVFTIIGCWHQDQRKLVTLGESFRRFHSETAFFPFARGGFRGIAEAPVAVGIGIVIAVGLRFFHGSLFG